MNGDVIERLRSVLGSGSVDDVEGTPRVSPSSTENLRLVCLLAGEQGWRIRVAGAGTWLAPDAPADIIVCTRELRETMHATAADQVATVSSGVTLRDLETFLAGQGMWLTIDPPGTSARTIGSVVATGTAGPLRAHYGQIKDHVLGCSVVTADGRLVEAGGQVVKNVAGFDITRLQVGGFGGFGIIAAVHLRLRARPQADATLIARGSRDELTSLARSILDRAIEVSALELLSPMVAAEPEWALAARFAGSETLVDAQVPHLTEASDVTWSPLTGARGAQLWRMVAGAANAGPVSFRLGVLVEGLDQAIDLIDSNLEDGLMTAGALTGGLRWTGVATVEQLLTLRHELAQQEIPLTLERAPWNTRVRVGHFGAYREGVGAVVGRLRQTFDPAGQLSVALEPANA